VFFERSALADEEILELEASFSPKALARRTRNRDGRPPVDLRDAPVPSRHIALLESTGFVVRSTSRHLGAVSVEGGEGQRASLLGQPEVLGLRSIARTLRPRLGSFFDGESGSDRERGATVDLSAELALLEIDRVREAGFFGTGVRVGLIDTGFDLSHPALLPAAARVIDSWDFLEDDPVVANETAAEDEVGQDTHGTSVLGVLTADGGPGGYLGAATGVSLLLAKSESVPLEAPFEEDLWIAAVEWAEQRGADFVSSSLAWSDWIDPTDLDGQTVVSSAFASSFAEATGLLLIQGIGNSGPDPGSLLAPSDSPGILSVGAVDRAGEVAYFSGRGPTADGRIKPELVAPGVDLASLDAGESGVSARSGTSLAAPFIAGLAAITIEAHPDWTLGQLRAALLAAGDQSAEPGNDRGWGLPSAWELCGLACTCHDDDGDGAWAVDCGGEDCDDSDPALGPGSPEIPYDGVDQDCDGSDLDDVDSDGFPGGPGGSDCADNNPAVFPAPIDESGLVLPLGGHELCSDSWDNDCDGLLGDADPDCTEGSGTGDGAGSSSGATTSGSWGCGIAQGAPAPANRPGSIFAVLGLFVVLLYRRRRASSVDYIVPGSRVPSRVQ